jgi:hypothetical protein
MNKLLLVLLIIILSSCASKAPKAKLVSVFADTIEIAITEKGDGLKFKTMDGTEKYRHSPLKASTLIGFIQDSIKLESTYKNNRRHKIDEKKTLYKESGVLITFSYNHSNKTSIIVLCFRAENASKKSSAICAGMESWKAKRLIEHLQKWKSLKKELD